MKPTAEILAVDAPPAPAPRAVLQLVEGDAGPDARERLILRLAADRLRDLRDDGVTPGYVAKMYDVDCELLARVSDELLPSRTR